MKIRASKLEKEIDGQIECGKRVGQLESQLATAEAALREAEQREKNADEIIRSFERAQKDHELTLVKLREARKDGERLAVALKLCRETLQNTLYHFGCDPCHITESLEQARAAMRPEEPKT